MKERDESKRQIRFLTIWPCISDSGLKWFMDHAVTSSWCREPLSQPIPGWKPAEVSLQSRYLEESITKHLEANQQHRVISNLECKQEWKDDIAKREPMCVCGCVCCLRVAPSASLTTCGCWVHSELILSTTATSQCSHHQMNKHLCAFVSHLCSFNSLDANKHLRLLKTNT